MPSSVKHHTGRRSTLQYGFAATAAGLLLAGCSLSLRPAEPQAPTGAQPPSAPALTAAPSPPQGSDTIAALLDNADRVRSLQGAELAQEITSLGEPGAPSDQLRLAMTLIQTRQLYDLVRAQELLQRVLANQAPDARALHPLARLLAARYAEQRRVEDQLDRQNQQLQGLQRRIGETQDKLDALKEIERSLTSRPAPAAPVPPAPAANGRPRPPRS